MARRKDHKQEELRDLIRLKALEIITTKGLKALTARRLADAIGYTPGTIYNFYPDMDSLVAAANTLTLALLEEYCQHKIKEAPKGFAKVRALAHAYVTFAHENLFAWEAIFMRTRKPAKTYRTPKEYEDRVNSLFEVIEKVLIEYLSLPADEARKSARLLWACLHGIAVLTLDGRLKAVGIDETDQIIDDLLSRYFHNGRKKP